MIWAHDPWPIHDHTAKTRFAPPCLAPKMTAHVRVSCQAHATTYMGPQHVHAYVSVHCWSMMRCKCIFFFQQRGYLRAKSTAQAKAIWFKGMQMHHAQAFVASADKHRETVKTGESPCTCSVTSVRLKQAGSDMWLAISAHSDEVGKSSAACSAMIWPSKCWKRKAGFLNARTPWHN